jgi:hypothetical protein
MVTILWWSIIVISEVSEESDANQSKTQSLSIVSLCSDKYTKVAVEEYKTSLREASIGERVQPTWNYMFIAFLFSAGVQVLSLLFHRKLKAI